MMSKQIENKYDTAKKMYPILKNYPYNIVETLDENSPYYLEHFSPEEVGSLENPRPKNLPIGEYGLQIFKDVRPEDIAGDIISHHIINKDKYLSKKYEEFKKLISKEDMLNRYNYHKNNLGEKRDFNNWSERTGYPELLRGYVFNQFDEKTKDSLYTLEQKEVLDSIKNYITQNEQILQAFKKGGTIMEQQMSLFDEGGMKDDGLDRDPVSGNEIPPGSLAKEVRDDIPAQLSEGEYVVPADVVQYYGVKFFEDLRMEAKRGLAEMEATGRIGGEPMSVTMIAIGKPEEEEEKKQKERQKKAFGGIIKANQGVLTADEKKIEQARTFNPYDFSVVGGTPFSPIARTGQSMNFTTPDTHSKMFYHPDGRVQAVPGRMVMVNGEQKFLPNPNYKQFTTGEWSDTPPAQAKAQETQAPKEDRDDRDSSIMNAEAQRLQTENSLKVSADRLKIPVEIYSQLSIGKRFRLMGEEFKAMGGNEVDQNKINEIVEGEDTGFNLGSVTQLVGGLVAAFTGNPLIAAGVRILGGILSSDDTDDTPTTPSTTVRSSGSLAPVATSTVFDSLAQASKAGYHGQNVNIKGKGVQKVEFADPKFNTAMKKKSASVKKEKDDNTPSFVKGMTDADKLSAKPKNPKAETFREKEKSLMQGSTKTAADIDRDIMGGDLNKGGLINKPKRNPKKPRGKGLGSK